MTSAGTIVQVGGIRDIQRCQRGNGFSRNYSSNGGKKIYKGARKLMISEETIVQMAKTLDIKVP
jgi:hypothetical protein